MERLAQADTSGVQIFALQDMSLTALRGSPSISGLR